MGKIQPISEKGKDWGYVALASLGTLAISVLTMGRG